MTKEETNSALKTAKEITGVIQKEYIINVVIDTNHKTNSTAGVYELTNEELKKIKYDDLNHSEIWIYDEDLEEERYKRIWNTKEQRDVLKQRWRDLKSSANAKRAERQAELRKQGGVVVVRL